jgi:hypothetical protein
LNQGVTGAVLFGLFFLFSEVFNIPIAFIVVCGFHLFNNLVLHFLMMRDKDFDGQDWKIRHYYEVRSNRDFEKSSMQIGKKSKSKWRKMKNRWKKLLVMSVRLLLQGNF